MPVVLEWAKGVVSPPFYWRNLTWTRYSPVVPRREEFESSDKQSREPPEKYNYGERCIRCAEAIRLSPNALWNRRASFELKTARLSTLTLSGLDTCGSVYEEQQHRIRHDLCWRCTSPCIPTWIVVPCCCSQASNPESVPRARPVQHRSHGEQHRSRVGPAARVHGTRRKTQLCAPPTPSFVPRHSAQTALTLQQGPAQGDVVHTRLPGKNTG